MIEADHISRIQGHIRNWFLVQKKSQTVEDDAHQEGHSEGDKSGDSTSTEIGAGLGENTELNMSKYFGAFLQKLLK